MKYLIVFLASLIILSSSRLIPHPPNFTSLIALSFYIPALFGTLYIPAVLLSFVLTDLIIGFHKVTFFTWGSIIVIGYLSKHLSTSITKRFLGIFISCFIFFTISNLGVWFTGYYEFSFSGLITCYVMAIPFFGNTLISTIIFSLIIEYLNKILIKKNSLLNLR